MFFELTKTVLMTYISQTRTTLASLKIIFQQQCCGATGAHDYYDSFWYRTNVERGTISFVPQSCCKQVQEARAWFMKPIDPMCISYNYYTPVFNNSVNAQVCHLYFSFYRSRIAIAWINLENNP